MMMHSPGTRGGDVAGLERLKQLWRQVCASRGTPAPNPEQLAGFMQGLGTPEREKLEFVLSMAARGREQPGDLSLVSWAAACTRPALLAQLAAHGLGFTSANLFACGLALKEQGWDMQPRLAQLASHPEDVAALRAWLPAAEPEEPQAQALALAASETLEEDALGEAFYPWPEDDRDDGPPDDHAPGWEVEAMDSVPAAPTSTPLAALPVLPTRFAREQLEPFSDSSVEPSARRASDESRLRLRLFGKSAAHTLEVTPHRRGGDFMGVHVVSIDSAHALGSSPGTGYAWERKLVLQLTPEEMPGLIATLMGITPSVRFGHHGADRSKFIEVRRQEGGLVIVTGERALSYSVPVPAGTVYYLLDLFCRAMAMGMGGGMEEDKPGRSVSDVLMLVRSAHGF
jgi:hypothetical protein